MSVRVEEIQLPQLAWTPGELSTVWFLQPRLHVDGDRRPFVHRAPGGGASPFQLLRRACLHEQRSRAGRPLEAPSFLLAPEFALHPDEVPEFRALVQTSPPNFVFVAGLGQMTRQQALTVENRPDLWEEPVDGRYTGCAAVAVGGTDLIHLQPKIVPSGPERDYHLKGTCVRLFLGDNVSFIVLICSELFERPEARTTISDVLREVKRQNRHLRMVVWIQHNQKPRSQAFVESIKQLRGVNPAPTVLLACSRGDRPRRMDNFSSSGAIVPHEALPRRLRDLDGRFRYVEPLAIGTRLARVVLPRYDADACRVQTVLADEIDPSDGVAKGALFQDVQPFVPRDDAVAPCSQNTHLEDLTERAFGMATREHADLADRIATVRQEVMTLSTAQFLRLLDLSSLPDQTPPPGHVPQHEPGYECVCWPHRRCLDTLTTSDETSRPLAALLAAVGAMAAAGVICQLRAGYDIEANCLARVAPQEGLLWLLDTLDFTVDRIKSRPPLESPAHVCVILGAADAPPARPGISSIQAGVVMPTGGVDPASAERPLPQYVARAVFWKAYEQGRLANLIAEQIGIAHAR